MEERKRIVILAAGDPPTHPIPQRALREADLVVCCDSAYSTIKNKELRIKNFTVIGDGDSLPEADKQALGDRWLQVDEQDYNDLHKAVAWALTSSPLSTLHSPLSVTILGATGRREDHTLGNISYLATFADEYPDVDFEMLTDHGRFTYCRGRHTYASFPGQQVSIFTLTPQVPLTLDGLRWPARGLTVSRWWQATLNSALGSQFTVDGGELLIFQTYDPK